MILSLLGVALPCSVGGARPPDGQSQINGAADSGLFVFTQFTDQGFGLDSAEAIYVVRPDGGRLKRLAGDDSCTDCADSPRWSPDGSKIAYSGIGHDYQSGLVVMNANGSGKRLICAECFGWSSWSADGRQLAAAWTGPGLDILDVRSHRIRHIMRTRKHLDVEDLDWSPEGTQLAFDDDVPGKRIYLVNSDGTRLRFAGPGGDPRWSPDGSTLLFVRPDRRALYLLPSIGGAPRRVDSFPANQLVTGSPAWSPDGHEIAYFGRHGIHILDLPTGKDREISLPHGVCTHAHWCADIDWQR